MQASVKRLLEQVSRRGSWVGGGSVAALSAALAAALLQKLVVRPQTARRLRGIWKECLELVEQDAVLFARVIQATRRNNRHTFARTLKEATEVPCRVFERAQAIQAACRAAQRAVKPRFQSDLLCAMAVAMAAGQSADVLIQTNLAWLDDRAYTKRIRRRLQVARRGHARQRHR